MFRSHDIVLIISPEYNGGITPLIANLVSWVSREKPNPFRHAIFGIGGMSNGKYATIFALSHLRDSLSKLGALVVPTLLGLGPYPDVFDDERRAERSQHPVEGRPDGARTHAFLARRDLSCTSA